MNMPVGEIIPSLSPSPSKDIPISACSSNTFAFNCSRFDSTHGSGWWFGKLPSLSSFINIKSIGNNSYTKAAVRDMDLPFGGELSGHVYFRDRWPGFDSGLYAGLRLLEILSLTDKNINELLNDLNKYYSTEELKFKTTDEKKFKIVDKVEEYAKSKDYKFLTIDGVKVLFEDGWALVRASNTGPNLTARFEARTEERLQDLQNEFIGIINENI